MGAHLQAFVLLVHLRLFQQVASFFGLGVGVLAAQTAATFQKATSACAEALQLLLQGSLLLLKLFLLLLEAQGLFFAVCL